MTEGFLLRLQRAIKMRDRARVKVASGRWALVSMLAEQAFGLKPGGEESRSGCQVRGGRGCKAKMNLTMEVPWW